MENLEQHLEHQKSQLSLFNNFFWHKIRSLAVARTIEKYSKSSNSVVDIGAGVGIFGFHLKKLAPNITYYFYEPLESLKLFLIQEFNTNRFVPESKFSEFQLFTMLDVLEHIDHDVGYLKNLYSHLPAGSTLVITVPALQVLWSDWDKMMGHVKRYDKKSLTNVCQQAGFKILECRYLFNFFVLPALIRKYMGASGPEFPQLHPIINSLFYFWAYLELNLFKKIPFGTSVLIVLKK